MSKTFDPLRGQVFFADLGEIGVKPVVVVSNNARNRRLADIVAARITTGPKPELPSIVPLPDHEPLVGRVVCDHIVTVLKRDLRRAVGGLSRRTMAAVDEGLRAALAL